MGVDVNPAHRDVRGDAMKFSVVIPTYNRAPLVGQAIASVLSQTYSHFEVLVVDDGSTDDTAARVARIPDPRIRYLRRPHCGVSAARNMGIAEAGGDFIAFLDSDDLWKPTKLQRKVDFLHTHPEVDVVFSDLEKFDGDEHVVSFMRTTPTFSKLLQDAAFPEGLVLEPRTVLLCLLEEVPIKIPTLTIRREALARSGLFDEQWSSSEDWELLLRLCRSARFGYIDEPLAVVRVLPTSLHRRDVDQGDRAMLELLTRELRTLDDVAARNAARRGVAAVARHLGAHYANCGRPITATRAYLRGFGHARDTDLLLRALGAWLPSKVRRRAGRLVRSCMSALAVGSNSCVA